jgi:hypothetical protein
MSTKLLFGRDEQGLNTYARPSSTNMYSTTLTAATEATVTVPSNFQNWIAYFSYEAAKNVWVAINATAAVPAGATLVASNSALNPESKVVKEGDVIHIITADATTDVGIELYPVTLL